MALFIYVMDLESKEMLERHGYKLLKADERNGVYCFENKPDMEFTLNCPCVFSSIMTF